jgi:hypothetical protein
MNILGYPRDFFRGVTIKDQLNSDLSAKSSIFSFDEKRNVPQRTDNNEEESINWNDDNLAFNFTMNQKKINSNDFMFIGAFTVCRKDLDFIRKLPSIRDNLTYERKIDENNPDNIYHGNLLLKKDTPQHTKKYIKGTIALLCGKAKLRENNPITNPVRENAFIRLYRQIINFIRRILLKYC